MNLLVNSNGTVVRSEVVGALKMRTFLSGMPECKLGLNDKARPLLLVFDCSRGLASNDNAHISRQCVTGCVSLRCVLGEWRPCIS